MTRENIVKLFMRRQESWRDPAALAADHTEDGVVESPSFGTAIGRAAILDSYEALFAAFSDMEFRVEEILVDGDRVAVSWTSTGTHSGPFRS